MSIPPVHIGGRFPRIARLDGDKYRFPDPAAVLAELRQAKIPADLFSFAQKVTETKPLYDYPMDWENYAVLPISTFDHWWKQQIGFKARNKAKQAERKGVVFREVPFDDELVHGIWKIYNECPIRQGRKFLHYGDDLETVRRQGATFLDSSVFIGAYVEGQLIGFIKLTMDETGSQAGLMHIISMLEHRDKAPTNGLIAQAVKACAERGVPNLVYSNFAYGNKGPDSLTDFKERNGFQRVDVPRYYVPLTVAGAVALRCGLHRGGLVAYLPGPVIAKLRAWRASWYSSASASSSQAAG